MATENRVSNLLPSIGEDDVWPKAVKIARVIVGATSSDGDEDIVSSGTTEDFVLWDVRAGTYVYGVTVNIETAFTASVTLAVGDTTDIDGWIETGQIAATSTGVLMNYSTGAADTTGTIVGLYALRGMYFPSSGAIELDISGASPTVGRAIFYVKYAQLSS